MNNRIEINKFFNPNVIGFGVEIDWGEQKIIEIIFFKYSILIIL